MGPILEKRYRKPSRGARGREQNDVEMRDVGKREG
jgi:hypothetical protein